MYVCVHVPVQVSPPRQRSQTFSDRFFGAGARPGRQAAGYEAVITDTEDEGRPMLPPISRPRHHPRSTSLPAELPTPTPRAGIELEALGSSRVHFAPGSKKGQEWQPHTQAHKLQKQQQQQTEQREQEQKLQGLEASASSPGNIADSTDVMLSPPPLVSVETELTSCACVSVCEC